MSQLDAVWREMRLHMEWSEGLCLCFLFSDDASASLKIAQFASDAWQWRSAPLTTIAPEVASYAAQEVLSAMAQHLERLRMTRAPVWVSLLAQDTPDQTAWELARAAVLARLNESREWLVKDFARPLVLCFPAAWRNRVASIAPDLWHVRAFSETLEPRASAKAGAAVDAEPHALLRVDALVQHDLAATLAALAVARERAQTRPRDHGLQRELLIRLADVGDAFLSVGALLDALAAYRESLEISRALREQLGDGPQVLRDLSVSLNKLGDAERQAGRGEAALAAYRESLEISRALREQLGDGPQVLDDLAVSLERCGASSLTPLPLRRAYLDEAVALREQLMAAISTEHNEKRLSVALALQRQWCESEGLPQ